MTRLLVAALSLSALGYLAYRTLYGRAPTADAEAPTQQLQNVRESAKKVEANDQQRVEDIDKQTQER